MTNIVNENIEYFLRTGELEHVRFGINRYELKNLLGETDWIYPEQRNPLIYKYSHLEFHFDSEDNDAKLVGIMYVVVTEPASNGNLSFQTHGWINGITKDQAERMLDTLSISYKSSVYEYDDDAWCIETQGKVSILFAKENSVYSLEKLGVFV